MWKDWLSFTRKEQYGLVILTILIVILLAVRVILPLLSKPAEIELISDVNFFTEESVETPDVKSKKSSHKTTGKSSYHFIRFNPNTVSVTELSRMGLSPFVIVNWMKYREAGGFFKEATDVEKIYGLDSLVLKEMRTFIYFSSIDQQIKDRERVSLRKNESLEHVPDVENKLLPGAKEQLLRIDINRADTARLRLINGIGPVFSQRIVDFRKVLGGFYSIEQLGEVYGLPPDLIEKVRVNLIVNSEDVSKMAVNSVSLRKLQAHPYINFYQAKEIVEYRRNNGSVTGREVLKKFSSFDEMSLEKVLPYLSFEEK
jgi:competence protein ComEA